MLKWNEYAIVRCGAQLRQVAAERPLTDEEQHLLEICQSATSRLEAREAQPPPPEKPKRRRSFAKWSAARPPLANSRYHD